MLKIATSILDRNCPIREFKLTRKKEEWMTADLLIMIESKNKLLTKAKATKQDIDWEIARVARNKVNSDVDKAKAKFLLEKLEQHKKDPKILAGYKMHPPRQSSRRKKYHS